MNTHKALLPDQHFKINFKKALLAAKLSPAAFGKKVGMSRQKVARLSSPCDPGSININDATIIADILGTTVGYMTNASSTDRGAKMIKSWIQHIDVLNDQIKTIRKAVHNDKLDTVIAGLQQSVESIDINKKY